MITPLTADSTLRTVDGTLRVSITQVHVGSPRGVGRPPLHTTITPKPHPKIGN